MNPWIHNLQLLYRLVDPFQEYADRLHVPSDRKWAGLIFLPKGLTEYEARQNRHLDSAEIIGGWPLIAAFDNDEDFILAKLRFT